MIEGITEFLPISSTGHLLIAEHWLGQRSEIFNVVIQSGAMLRENHENGSIPVSPLRKDLEC